MLLENKKVLIMGIRNKWSIAYGIAKSAYENGAKLIFTYMGEENKDKISEDQLKPLGINLEELIKSLTNNEIDPLLKLEYISGLIIEDEEKKEETNQEETQNKGTETNSGDTKAISQDVSSKVPAKAEEKKTQESFSNELAEDLYKYLRG